MSKESQNYKLSPAATAITQMMGRVAAPDLTLYPRDRKNLMASILNAFLYGKHIASPYTLTQGMLLIEHDTTLLKSMGEIIYEAALWHSDSKTLMDISSILVSKTSSSHDVQHALSWIATNINTL
jgi:hypothetical protein